MATTILIPTDTTTLIETTTIAITKIVVRSTTTTVSNIITIIATNTPILENTEGTVSITNDVVGELVTIAALLVVIVIEYIWFSRKVKKLSPASY